MSKDWANIIFTEQIIDVADLPKKFKDPLCKLFTAAGIGNGENYCFGVGDQGDESTAGFAESYETGDTVGVSKKLDKWIQKKLGLKKGDTIELRRSW